jgi:hypothetical protein
MFKEWLLERVTVDAAEKLHAVQVDELGPNPVPFGFQNGAWRSFIANMRPGDEIWEFSSPAEDWENLAGRGGYAMVRGGEIVQHIVTIMN